MLIAATLEKDNLMTDCLIFRYLNINREDVQPQSQLRQLLQENDASVEVNN
jgi:hypothetical protein